MYRTGKADARIGTAVISWGFLCDGAWSINESMKCVSSWLQGLCWLPVSCLPSLASTELMRSESAPTYLQSSVSRDASHTYISLGASVWKGTLSGGETQCPFICYILICYWPTDICFALFSSWSSSYSEMRNGKTLTEVLNGCNYVCLVRLAYYPVKGDIKGSRHGSLVCGGAS